MITPNIYFSHKFGKSYLDIAGYIVEPSMDIYNHRFGGNSWLIKDVEPINEKPQILFVFDLSDPKLFFLKTHSLAELPICSYLDSNFWLKEQIYKINKDKKTVDFYKINSEKEFPFEESHLPNPLPERKIHLREMNSDEYPIDENAYWHATDEFLGGNSVFRVGGRPLWLNENKDINCPCCKKEMIHVVSMGYEPFNGPYRFIENMPFFIGEAALYVFFCKDCELVKVISQV